LPDATVTEPGEVVAQLLSLKSLMVAVPEGWGAAELQVTMQKGGAIEV
jgi:hypothetical protein